SAELSRDGAEVAAVLLDDGEETPTLARGTLTGQCGSLAHGLRQMLEPDVGAGDRGGGGKTQLELTDVEGPRVGEERPSGVAREGSRRAAPVVPREQRRGEQAQVLAALLE